MADQNQTVNTIFTGQADLAAAEKQLEAFVKNWETGLGKVAKATDAIDMKMLKTLEHFNKVMGVADKFQKNLEKNSLQGQLLDRGTAGRRNIKGQAATIEGELFDYRRKVSKALAGTVLEIDAQLRKLDERLAKIGTQRKKYASEISNLAAQRDALVNTRATVANNPFVAGELAGARSSRAKANLRAAAAEDRSMATAAEQLVRSRVRLVEVETQLANLDARAGGKVPGRIRGLKDEKAQLDQLIKAYEGVGEVSRRASNEAGKLLGASLDKGRKDIASQARQVLESEKRIAEIKERINQSETGQNTLNAAQLQQLKLEIAMNERVLSLHQADAAVMERVARLREKANAASGPKAVNLDASAKRVLDIEKLSAKAQAEIIRLKATGTAEDARQATLLQSQLTRLAKEAAELTNIAGIEARITLERTKQAQVAKPKSPHTPDLARFRADGGVGIMGVQTEVMANYAMISGMQQSAYALGEFVVQYEAALAQFQAIASASGVETASLSKSIVDLGQNTRFTNLQLAETATLLAQAGLNARDTQGALSSIAMLAAAAGTELRQAADVVTSIATVWNITTDQYGEIADVLASMLNRTKLGIDQIQLGIQYAANTAEDAGVSFTELTAAFGAAANAGIRSGSTLGTGMRALIVDLQNPTDKARAVFDRLGLTIADLDIRTVGLTQVMENLKKKGFSSADAMSAFEVRAAAMYSAVSNNVDVLRDLQEQTHDTNAATEANAVQMDTIIAKWTQFTNVLKSGGDGALAPVVMLLKGFLDIGTGLIGMLGSLGPVGQGAAVGITALMVALTISKFVAATQALGAMATAITLLPPVLAAATGTTQALAVAQVEAAAATTLWGRAVATFGRVPIVLLIAGLAAVVAAVASASGAFGSASDRSDQLKGEINDLTAQLDETKKSIRSVDDTIDKMSNTLNILAKNDALRGRVIQEARDKFEALGLKVDDNVDSINDMIEALRALRSELQKEFSSELLALADRLEERAQLLNLKISEGQAVSPEKRVAVAKAGLASMPSTVGQDGKKLESAKFAALGPSATFAFDAVMGQRQIQDSSGNLTGTTAAEMRKVQQDLSETRRGMQARLNAETDPRKRKAIDDEISSINTLIAAYAELLASLREVGALGREIKDVEADEAYSTFMSRPDLFKPAALPKRIDTEMAPYMVEMQDLMGKKLPPEEQVKQADEIAARMKLASQNLYQEAVNLSLQLNPRSQERYRTDMSTLLAGKEATAVGWIDDLRAGGARGASASAALGQQANNDDQTIDRDVAAARTKTIERQMDELEAELASARTGAQVELLRSRMDSLLKQWEPLRREQSSASLAARGYYDRGGTVDTLAPAVEWQESRGKTNAVSSAGALGVMQLMPGTARAAARRLGRTDIAALSQERLREKLLADPDLNRTLGREELRYLLQRYDGNTVLALAAYNAGPGRLDGYTDKDGKFHAGWLKTIGDPRKLGGPSNEAFAAAIPIAETKDYVAKIMTRTGPMPSTDQDPRFGVITGEERAQAAADVSARRTRFDKAARDKELSVENADIARALTAERATNERQIKFLLDNLKSAEGDIGQLTQAVGQVDLLGKRNFDITEEAFWNNPRNADRRDDPEAIREVGRLLEAELTEAAENMQEAMDGLIEARTAVGERGVASAQDQVRRAQATPGTSQTTLWRLGQRVDWEEYQAALIRQTAVEEALAIATAAHAQALEDLNEATILAEPVAIEMAALTAQMADPAITAEQRRQLLIRMSELEVVKATAQSTIDLAKARVALTSGTVQVMQGEQRDAAAGVTGATPVGTISASNQGATFGQARTPFDMIKDAASRYEATSGVFNSVSEDIATGISGTFDALAAGINKTISQIADGSITIKGAFRNILGGILQELQSTATKIAANMVMKWLLQTVISSFGNPMAGASDGLMTPGSFNPGATPGSLGMPNLHAGGEVKAHRMAAGGGVMNRDSVRILAEPGEVMMRKSAVQMIGKQNLLNINALGNRSLSQAGAAGARVIQKEADKVNVWVVSQNQVPPPGPKDIIQHVATDIAQGGTLKKLVRQVAMGG